MTAPASTQPVIAVVLVNYNGATETGRCLSALEALVVPKTHRLQVVVVDNASPDDSLTALKHDLENTTPIWPVELIASPTNGGFSAGNNQGIRWALEHNKEHLSFVWLLNHDTQPAPQALLALLQCAEAQEKPSLLGSVLRYPDGRFQQGGIRINRWTGQLRGYPESPELKARRVDAVSGASLFIPRSVLDVVGLLDEAHFLYVEDVDYCLSARAKGIETWLVPDSVVLHEEGASTGKTGRRASLMTQYYYQRNRMTVLSQNTNPLQWTTLHLYTVFRWVRMGLKAIVNPTRRDEWAVLTRALCDYGRGVRGASF